MGKHSVADAKNRLSELINRALAGEAITITRHGTPVIELKPVHEPPRPITKADVDWLRAQLVEGNPREDAGALVSRMRDEDWR